MNRLRLTTIEGESSKILKEQVRIMYFSDTHIKKNFSYEKLKLIKTFLYHMNPKPDFILLGGDLIDDTKLEEQDFIQVKEFVEAISANSKIPVVIGTGNHDQMTKNPDASFLDRINPKRDVKAWLPFINQKWIEELQATPNIYILQTIPSHTVHFKNLGIAVGEVPLPYAHYEEDHESVTSFLNYANSENFDFRAHEHNILLSHTPNAICEDEAQEGLICADMIDEAYSGHNHGGISPRWFNRLFQGRGIINPQMKLFRNYCAGIVNGVKFPVIISTGVSKMNIGLIDDILTPEVMIEDIKRK